MQYLWLIARGPVLMEINVRHSKFNPVVEEGQLLQSNSNYSHIRYSDGREDKFQTDISSAKAPRPSNDAELFSDDEPNIFIEASCAPWSDIEPVIYESRTADTAQPEHFIRSRRPSAYWDEYQTSKEE